MLQFLKVNDETRFFNRIKVRSGNYEKKGDPIEIKKYFDYNETLREYISVKCVSFEERWKMRLEEVSKYIDENDKRPSCIDKDKNISKLGNWTTRQVTNYSRKRQMMKVIEICQITFGKRGNISRAGTGRRSGGAC